jgi:hypothetical protein
MKRGGGVSRRMNDYEASYKESASKWLKEEVLKLDGR